jgi:uncharacterized protein YndB with AHSA1/START domain
MISCMTTHHARLERTYTATPETIWELWTTPEGIESWWAPEGFKAEVRALDLRPGGELVHAMTATAPEQVEFMRDAGMPLTTEARKTFTEVEAPRRLAYRSLIDFVPDHDPYEHLTVVELEPEGGGTHVTMTVEPLHDAIWTGRLLAGRENELANLERLLADRA